MYSKEYRDRVGNFIWTTEYGDRTLFKDLTKEKITEIIDSIKSKREDDITCQERKMIKILSTFL